MYANTNWNWYNFEWPIPANISVWLYLKEMAQINMTTLTIWKGVSGEKDGLNGGKVWGHLVGKWRMAIKRFWRVGMWDMNVLLVTFIMSVCSIWALTWATALIPWIRSCWSWSRCVSVWRCWESGPSWRSAPCRGCCTSDWRRGAYSTRSEWGTRWILSKSAHIVRFIFTLMLLLIIVPSRW